MTVRLATMIVADRHTLGGKPRIDGTRISVDLILECIAAGWTFDDILKSYPHLTREGIQACINYARDVIAEESILFSAGSRVAAE